MGDIIFTAKNKITENSKAATWVADGDNLLLRALQGFVQQKGDQGEELLIGAPPENEKKGSIIQAFIGREKEKKYIATKCGGIGEQLFLVVQTKGMRGREIKANIIDKDGVLQGTKMEPLTVMQGKQEIVGLKAKVRDDDFAIFPFQAKRKDDKATKQWRDKIAATETKQALLCVLIDGHTSNTDLEITYSGTNPTTENNSPTKGKANYWLDTEGTWFELKDCFCCLFKIENNILTGPNVVKTKDGNKVTSRGTMGVVSAIILHRTAGSTLAGAISHSKGTHFYVDGPRGNDGEIFHPFDLTKSSSHIRSSNDKTRISRKDIDNNNSIGIEVVGMAYTRDPKTGEYKTVYGTKPAKNAKYSKGYTNVDGTFYWDALSEKQVQSIVCLIKALLKHYNLKKADILMHEDIQIKTAGEGTAVWDAIKDKIE